MENQEEIHDVLTLFEKKPSTDIPPVLEDYLKSVAKTGKTLFPWNRIKTLFITKVEQVMDQFNRDVPYDHLPPFPNVENTKYIEMQKRIVEAMHRFTGAPFTVQRICELVTQPRKHYTRCDKFLRGIEKNVMVVSTVDPFGRKIVSESTRLMVNGLDTNGFGQKADFNDFTEGQPFGPILQSNWSNNNAASIWPGAGVLDSVDPLQKLSATVAGENLDPNISAANPQLAVPSSSGSIINADKLSETPIPSNIPTDINSSSGFPSLFHEKPMENEPITSSVGIPSVSGAQAVGPIRDENESQEGESETSAENEQQQQSNSEAGASGNGSPSMDGSPSGDGSPRRDGSPSGDRSPRRDGSPSGDGSPSRDGSPSGVGSPSRDGSPSGDGSPSRDESPSGDGSSIGNGSPSRDDSPSGDGSPSRDESPSGDGSPSRDVSPSRDGSPSVRDEPQEGEVSSQAEEGPPEPIDTTSTEEGPPEKKLRLEEDVEEASSEAESSDGHVESAPVQSIDEPQSSTGESDQTMPESSDDCKDDVPKSDDTEVTQSDLSSEPISKDSITDKEKVVEDDQSVVTSTEDSVHTEKTETSDPSDQTDCADTDVSESHIANEVESSVADPSVENQEVDEVQSENEISTELNEKESDRVEENESEDNKEAECSSAAEMMETDSAVDEQSEIDTPTTTEEAMEQD